MSFRTIGGSLAIVLVAAGVVGLVAPPLGAILFFVGVLVVALVVICVPSRRLGTVRLETMSMGKLSVTSGKLIVFDSRHMSGSCEIEACPLGIWEVIGVAEIEEDMARAASFEIEFRSSMPTAHTLCSFSVDVGLAMIADGGTLSNFKSQPPSSQLAFYNRITEGIRKRSNLRPYFETFIAPFAEPWCVVTETGFGDGLYQVHVYRDDQGVCRLSCSFIDRTDKFSGPEGGES